MEDQAFFIELFHRYITNKCSPGEVDKLIDWLQSTEDDEIKHDLIHRYVTEVNKSTDNYDMALESRMEQRFDKIMAHLQVVSEERKSGKLLHIKWRSVAAAAAIIFGISAFSLFFFNKPSQNTVTATLNNDRPINTDVAPGGNKAILTLANGSTMVLDRAKNGAVASQGNSKVVKINNGQLVYNALPEQATVVYNTLTTPRGGQFRLTLADGTNVWLNAESSLHFPTTFSGNERVVELTGEAYFEVTKNANMPFRVKNGDMTVQVLGTHFNVNAYKEENVIQTTLLEGSVNIISGGTSKILQPGQQAQTNSRGIIKIEKDVDVNTVVAWKNGLFNFNRSNIKGIMNQISRWYDIDIKYSGTISNQLYGGEMQRDLQLSQVLKILEKSGVRFNIQNKTLTVMQ